MDLRDRLGDVSAPVLLITADSDTSTPPETVLPLAKAIPGARLEVVEQASHRHAGADEYRCSAQNLRIGMDDQFQLHEESLLSTHFRFKRVRIDPEAMFGFR